MAFDGKQFHCWMSCDHELANEWARYSGKNASYITIDYVTRPLIKTTYTCENLSLTFFFWLTLQKLNKPIASNSKGRIAVFMILPVILIKQYACREMTNVTREYMTDHTWTEEKDMRTWLIIESKLFTELKVVFLKSAFWKAVVKNLILFS